MHASVALDFVTTVAYTLPGICLGLGYILAFNRPPVELVGTSAIIVAVLAAKELAISTRAFSSALAQVPAELDMAAADLGTSAVGILGRVLAPNLLEAAGVSLVNGFSSAMVSYSAVLFLVTPANKTAVFELFDALSGGKYGEGGLAATVEESVFLGGTCELRLLVDAPGSPEILARVPGDQQYARGARVPLDIARTFQIKGKESTND